MLVNSLSRCTLWLRTSLIGRIFSAALLIAVLSILVKAMGFGKEILVARYFGTDDALDSFYAAFVLPTFLIGIIANSCNDAFIPTYLQVYEHHGHESVQRLLSNVCTVYILIFLTVSLLLAFSQAWILPLLSSGFGPAKLHRTRLLFYILVSTLTLSGISALWRAVLNAHERFTLTAIAPIAFPASIALLLIVRAPTWGIYALVSGSIIGLIVELSVNGFGVSRLGFRLLPRWHGYDSHLRQVLSQSLPAAASALLMGSTALVDQSMAAMLGPGKISALNYANRLVSIVLSVGATSLSIAIFPSLSRLCASGNWESVRRVISTYSYIILLITVPITLVLIGFSASIVRLSFQRGAFTMQVAHLVAHVQSLLALEVPFYALCILCASAICALKRNSILLYGTTICVVANVTFNYLFMKVLGLPGIALSTSAVYMLSFIYLRLALNRALSRAETNVTKVPAGFVEPELI